MINTNFNPANQVNPATTPAPQPTVVASANPVAPSGLKGFFVRVSSTLVGKVVMGIAVLAVLYFGASVVFPKSSITVVGQGSYDFTPDEVSMVVSLVSTGTDPSQTINNGDVGIKVLLDAAKSIAGEDLEIKKAFYQAQPVSGLAGAANFQVVNAFSLKFSQVDKVSEMIKTLYANGATTISNVTFSSKDEVKIAREARKKAVADAREQASSLARASGKRLGRLVAITDDNQGASGSVASVAAGDEANLSNVAVSKTVSVMFYMW